MVIPHEKARPESQKLLLKFLRLISKVKSLITLKLFLKLFEVSTFREWSTFDPKSIKSIFDWIEVENREQRVYKSIQ